MPTLSHKLLLGSALIALAVLAHAADGTSGASDAAGPGAPPPSGAAATTTAVPNPANNAATDPYVQRREATSKAKAEYNAKKKAAKEEYKAAKKAIDADMKASGSAAGAESSGSSGK